MGIYAAMVSCLTLKGMSPSTKQIEISTKKIRLVQTKRILIIFLDLSRNNNLR
jgi:hypothetical protein